jgi:polysaccharide chain length determinant protein (PEP-CTERM system associated)
LKAEGYRNRNNLMQNELRLLLYYWELFWRRPILWLAPGILVLLAGTIYILSQPRTYTSEATVVVRSDRISPTLVESTVTNERLHFIEQRVLVRDNLVALATKFDLFPGLRDTLSKSNLAALVRAQIRIISDTQQAADSNRSTFRISFSSGSPELAAAVTSEIVSMIVNENRRVRLSQASDATHFLEREVDMLTERVHGLDAKWDEFIRVNQDALPSRQSALLQEIRSKEEELAQIETRNAELVSSIRILKAELDLGRPLADATVRTRTEQLSALKTQLATRLSILSEAHPEIKNLRSRIASLEGEIAQSGAQSAQNASDGALDAEDLGPELGLIAERIKTAEQQQAVLAERREKLNASLVSLRETVSRMPEVEAEMAGLERQKNATQRNLDDMAAKLNTARLSERLEFDQQGDQIEVLEPAEVPQHASGPGRRKMMLMVVLLAGGAGLATVLAADMMDRTIRGSFDLAPALEGRTLVVVPNWSDEAATGPRKALGRIFIGLALLVAAGNMVQHGPALTSEPARPASLTQAA